MQGFFARMAASGSQSLAFSPDGRLAGRGNETRPGVALGVGPARASAGRVARAPEIHRLSPVRSGGQDAVDRLARCGREAMGRRRGGAGNSEEVATIDLNRISPGNARVRDLLLDRGTLWASLGRGESEMVATLDPRTLEPDEAQAKRQGSLQLGHRLCLSPDLKTLAAATKNRIRLTDTESGAGFRDLVDSSIDISHDLDGAHDYQSLQFSPDGSLLASCRGRDGYVGLWDVAGARIVARIPMLNRSGCNSAFSPDGRYLAVPEERGVVLYELLGRDIARTASQNHSCVSDFDWSPTDVLSHGSPTVAMSSR